MSLTPLSEALDTLLTMVPPPPDSEWLPLEGLLGRVLAESVAARADVPAADNSAMDGFALRAGDLPGELLISQRIAAGAPAEPLAPGTAARIFTGGVIPEGADTVVMQEDALVQGDRVSILGCVTPGAHIRRCAADQRGGETVLAPGQVLAPQHVGMIAAAGHDVAAVHRRLRVAVLSTGNELVEPGESVSQPWEVFNSNRFQIMAQLQALGCEPVAYGRLPDAPDAIGAALERAAAECDCIVSSGGVSVGGEDHVRGQIEARGELRLWKLAMKPGKPLAFGHVANTPVFGLPGNPVSAWATLALVVRPWLLCAMGARFSPPVRYTARAGFAVQQAGGRDEYLRVRLEAGDDGLSAVPVGSQSSAVLTSVGVANGLAVVPAGTRVSAGDPVEVLSLAEILSPWCG